MFNLCLINKLGLETWAQTKAAAVRRTYFTQPWPLAVLITCRRQGPHPRALRGAGGRLGDDGLYECLLFRPDDIRGANAVV